MKLAIKGHSTRGKEIIALLKMLGGANPFLYNGEVMGTKESNCYYISEDTATKYISWDYIGPEEIEKYKIFTLEEFLEKYPFKVGDKVKYINNIFCIKSAQWDSEKNTVIYYIDADWSAGYVVETNDLQPYKGTNIGTDVNNNKPLFKAGDVVKLKGCPDKNLFWIVMDVVKDGYIFNDGKKYSFDDQHHYEKSNREVINMTKETFTPAPDITANITDKNNCDIVCPDGYEFYDENGNLIGNKVMMRPKKPKYPTTYEDCCKIKQSDPNFYIDTHLYSNKLGLLYKLLICRDAYWKIAGEQMGLGKPWEPDWEESDGGYRYCIVNRSNNIVLVCEWLGENYILSFPTEEMRDAFYENFKDLIEQCKELL